MHYNTLAFSLFKKGTIMIARKTHTVFLLSLYAHCISAGDFPDLTTADDFVHVSENIKTIWKQVPLTVTQHPDDGFVIIDDVDTDEEKMHESAIKKGRTNVIQNSEMISDDTSEYSECSIHEYYIAKKDRARQYELNHHYKGSYHKAKQGEARIAHILLKKNDYNPAHNQGKKDKTEKTQRQEKNCAKPMLQQSISHQHHLQSHNSSCMTMPSVKPSLAMSLNPAPILPAVIIVHQLWPQ